MSETAYVTLFLAVWAGIMSAYIASLSRREIENRKRIGQQAALLRQLANALVATSVGARELVATAERVLDEMDTPKPPLGTRADRLAR